MLHCWVALLFIPYTVTGGRQELASVGDVAALIDFWMTNDQVLSQYREWTVGPLNRITHLITIMAASQLHVLANENAELAGCSQ